MVCFSVNCDLFIASRILARGALEVTLLCFDLCRNSGTTSLILEIDVALVILGDFALLHRGHVLVRVRACLTDHDGSVFSNRLQR